MNFNEPDQNIEVKDLENTEVEDLENNEHEYEHEQVKATPTMVISVIGDSDSFVPRPWPKTVFQTALIEAAKSGRGKDLINNNIRYVKEILVR